MVQVNFSFNFNQLPLCKSKNLQNQEFQKNDKIYEPLTSIYEEWNYTIEGTDTNGADVGYGVTSDLQGNVYITGGVTNIDTESDIILRKYNSNGDLEWENITDGPWDGIYDNDIGYDVAIDNNNNVYITGAMCNTSDEKICFLMKFNNEGVFNWSSTWNATNADDTQGKALAIDQDNNIYIGGTFNDQTVNKKRGFLLKFNETGQLNWSRTYHYSGSSDTQIEDIVIDSENKIYIVGYNNTGTSTCDIQIVKYNTLGIQLWNRTFDQYQYPKDIGTAIDVDSEDNIYIGGHFSLNIMLLAKYDKNGQYLKNITFDEGEHEVRAIDVVKSTGDIFLAFPSNFPSSDHIIVLKYNSTLDLQWKLNWDLGSGNEYINDICINNLGFLYLIGRFYDTDNDILFIKFSLSPPKISLVGDSLDNPDSDGNFLLNWTIPNIINVDNYTLYNHTSYISEINGSLNIMAIETTLTTWDISDLSEGTYYYIVEAHNVYGNTTSNCLIVNVGFSTSTIGGVSDDDNGGSGDDESQNYIILIIIAIGIIIAGSLIGFIMTKKFKKGPIYRETKVGKLEESREEVTEDDISLSKEKHFCLVHKGPIEGYNYICPKCGAYYCARCIEAIKDIENRCWSCQAPIDASMPQKVIQKDDELDEEIKKDSKDISKKAKDHER